MSKYVTAPNGMNFRRSVGNPTSRLERIRTYLRTCGRATKRDILRNVFGKEIRSGRFAFDGLVSSGWASYVFTYGNHAGLLVKERVGNNVYWNVGNQ